MVEVKVEGVEEEYAEVVCWFVWWRDKGVTCSEGEVRVGQWWKRTGDRIMGTKLIGGLKEELKNGEETGRVEIRGRAG